MTITIGPANGGQALKDFLALPTHVYAQFPQFVPPLTMDREGLLHPDKAAFFDHGDVQYWIAYRDGEPVGRISAQIDHAQPDDIFDGAGLFGCLDAIDDAEVVNKLLDAAQSWLRAQGKTRIVGPFSLSINGEPGLLVDGQDEPPVVLVSWHPRYLEQHLNDYGFAKLHDMHYWRLDDIPNKLDALKARKRVGRTPRGVTVRELNMKDLATEVEIIRQIYNDAWEDNWGHVPLLEVDMEAITKDLKPFIKQEYGLVVEKDGEPIAMGMVIPNLFEITHDVGPDPSPFGWAKLGWRTFFHGFRTGNIQLLGVKSQYQHSVGGAVVAMTMVDEITERFLSYKHKEGWLEAGYVLEDNHPLRRILVEYGFEIKRTVRVFDKALDA